MFKASLAGKLKRIFQMNKVTYDLPSESQEQEAIFVEIDECKTKITDAREIAKVTGKIKIFANSDKLPYGFLTKRIAEAHASDVKDLMFYSFEENHGTFGNIAERSMQFVYLFDSQYNPELGTMTELTLSTTET